MIELPQISDVISAAERIAPYVKKTPVLTCSSLNEMVEAELFFKCENFQKVGAFKFRGATNAVFSLPEADAGKGVATHSSGNHAAALALAARERGIKAYVVMPDNSPKVKKAAVAGYGAEIIYCKPTLEARESTLEKVVEKTGATFIHPYHNFNVIAGAGTAGKELVEEVDELDFVIAPIGGGGLISGTSISVTELALKAKVIGAEPEGADDAFRSLKEERIIPSENPDTVCDGLLTSLSERTFNIIKQRVDRIITVSDEATIAAMRHIWERMKIIVEPSAAITFGILLEKKVDLSGKRIGIIFSGGNVDLEKLPWNPGK
ncbi:MAG: pyridoxal-phosphate dependent enzyme [candidate division Zixibacteria bacterium]|nr:pyridoxal-phosphate dependent enzyme [candidate division Zixibacteria bacterium]